MKNMKVGVTTFLHTQSNYGQVLQAFALQKVLKSLGYDVYVLKEEIDNSFPLWLKFIGYFKTLFSLKLLKLKFEHKSSNALNVDRHFSDFIHNNISVFSIVCKNVDEFRLAVEDFDILITGSDQVWNKYMTKSKHSFYLLDFGRETTRKIAYAASFGRNKLYFYEKKYFKECLSKFSMVTVREKKGIDICNRLGINAIMVCDPVALLDKKDWMSFVINNKNVDVFAYMIASSNGESSLISPTIDLLQKNNFKIKYCSASRFDDPLNNVYPSIEEWLSYISNAKFVITDSFHCCMFCIIFNTPFIVLPREGEASCMNDRLISLLNVVGLSERMASTFNQFSDLLMSKINWERVNKLLMDYRNKSMKFLVDGIS